VKLPVILLRGLVSGAVAAGLAYVAGSLADEQPAGGRVLLGLAAVAFGCAFAAFMVSPAARAVSSVSLAAARLAENALGERVPLAGEPQLTSSFNAMSARVQELFSELRAEHGRIEAVFNASADAMVALSGEGVVRFANDAALAMAGSATRHVVDRPLIEVIRDHEIDSLVKRAARHAEPQSEIVIVGPSRTRVRASVLPIADGGDWALLLVLTDLSDVTRIDAVRRDFVANVSHELRTPLAAIRALAETIETGSTEPGAETYGFARRIREQTDGLTALVNELLDLSRFESGAVELRPEPLDLAALTAEAAEAVRPTALARSIRISLQAPGTVTVEADRAAIHRVLVNLLGNAVKFSPSGGEVTVDVAMMGSVARAAVVDQGPGIAEHELPRVFERFYKGDAARSGEGSGLGLAIVKHLVKLHGGGVDVTSTPGHGATFTLTLPVEFAGVRLAAHRA
jgi:two-component system phosphate regulon sensor histidine kinase PhoR